MTAGHVIANLDNLFKESREWQCFFRSLASPRRKVHFNYQGSRHFDLRRLIRKAINLADNAGDRGLRESLANSDVGFVELIQLYADALVADGVIPLEMSHLKRHREEEVQGVDPNRLTLMLYGVPTGTIHVTERGLDAHAVCAPVVLDRILKHQRYRYVPDWPPELHDGDVKGMSGGPIVALGWDEPVLVGIQSSRRGQEGKVPRWIYAYDPSHLFPMIGRFLDVLDNEVAAPGADEVGPAKISNLPSTIPE